MTYAVTHGAPPMIGRDDELDRLGALLARARGGERQLVFVIGEAGLGKSRLVVAAASLAIDLGFEVLTGQCHEGDRGLPLAPFVEAVRQRIGGLAPGDARAYLGSACPTLASLIPEIASLCAPGSVGKLKPEQAKHVVFESFAGLLVHRATLHPVLLIVEDAQWADPTSFELLTVLARRTLGHRVAIFATIRAESGEATSDPSLAAVRRLAEAQEVRLRPLDRASTASLMGTLLQVPPSEVFVAEVERRSGGNPLFIRELVAAGPGSDVLVPTGARTVPPGLADVVLRRVDELAVEDRAVVDLAAVIGAHVSESIVAAAGGWEPDLVSDAFTKARRAGILETVPEPSAIGAVSWHFHHELTREAMYERIEPSRRRKLHAQVAEAMLSAAALDRGTSLIAPGTLARHLHAAGAWPLALEQSLLAADAARRIHATHEALVNDRRALDAALALGHPAVGGLHLVCGQDLAILGDVTAAETHFREARRHAVQEGSLVVEQAAVDGLAGLAQSRDYAMAEALAREGLALAERIGDERTIARSLNRLGNIVSNGLRFAEGRAMHEAALERFRQVEDAWGVADALDLIAMTHYLGGDIGRAREEVGQAAAIFDELNDSERLASSLTSRGLYLAVLDGACSTDVGPDAYRADAEDGLKLAKAIGWRAGEAYALAALACAALGSGEIATARAWVADARGVADSIEHRQWTLLTEFVAGLIDVAVNDESAALLRFEMALALAVSIGSAQWNDRCSAWVDGINVLRGDAVARARLGDRVQLTGHEVERIGQRRALLALAEAVLPDDPDAALLLLDPLANVPDPSAGVLLLHAEACRLAGFVERAADDLSRAEAIARDVGPRPLVWRIAAARGRLWHGREPDRRAVAIRTARQELGALAESSGEADRSSLLRSPEARAVLGPNKRRAVRSGTTLSDREYEVADRIARGLHNKEIAAELGIAPKTVEMHIANAFAKLGVSSRASLAAWVASDGKREP